uniref:Uncharacterized protein n=1 Tax=Candidatus Kentrum sp. SD TaxID=2126332 RepID=A0A451BL14_9GAMM|nr:MAG: hypothetical protein BECKSD772F_GA0070984_103030 [Candidatus Kentron sp. SD]VFK43217.1 MAG: hypothetical protein BECKSD772E_GA0070983_102330 [Candidatus Kentron sp. SD]VFK78989.1 MAG: hypothetical protein BECKSD772D_GA0070982_103125 [Candidatus Kentron sp. SD]
MYRDLSPCRTFCEAPTCSEMIRPDFPDVRENPNPYGDSALRSHDSEAVDHVIEGMESNSESKGIGAIPIPIPMAVV